MAGRGRQDWSWVGKKACMTPGRHVVEHDIIGGLPAQTHCFSVSSTWKYTTNPLKNV